jgi:hypothetical protein
MKIIIPEKFKDKKNIVLLFAIIVVLLATFFFDKGLSVGLILLIILSGITFFVLNKLGFKNKRIYILFLIVLAIHLSFTLFMHYTNFQPFSSGMGDYLTYQKSAINFSNNFKRGNFSLEDITLASPGLYAGHYYPAIVGAVYALTLPEVVIGLMVNVWLVALTVVFVYLIILEIGAAEKKAFIVGLITAVYPSYLFNSGLLLKDPFEIFFTILSLLFLVKTVKKFSWLNFAVFYLATLCATHFRFYIGFALIATFILSWFLFSKINFKKRAIYGVIFIVILGFIPQVAAGQGYYGMSTIMSLANPRMVSFYRQSAYNPSSAYNNQVAITPISPVPASANPASTQPALTKSTPAGSSKTAAVAETPGAPIGLDSSFSAEDSPLGFIKSFIYILLGPLPWQIKNLRQALALFETIPWYLMLFFVVEGVIVCFKNRNRQAASLLIFSILLMVVIAVFDSNYGLIVRIRIPAFISLLCIASFGLNKSNIIYNYLEKIYAKVFGYWGSRIHRIQHS